MAGCAAALPAKYGSAAKEKKESGHFQIGHRVDDPCKHTILYPELQIERAGRRERGRGSATATGTLRGHGGRPGSVPPNRSRAGARRGRRAGSAPRPNRRCGPYGGSLFCAPYRCTFVRRPHNGNRSNRPYVSRGNDGCGACTRRIQPVKSCLSARPSSRRLPACNLPERWPDRRRAAPSRAAGTQRKAMIHLPRLIIQESVPDENAKNEERDAVQRRTLHLRNVPERVDDEANEDTPLLAPVEGLAGIADIAVHPGTELREGLRP